MQMRVQTTKVVNVEKRVNHDICATVLSLNHSIHN